MGGDSFRVDHDLAPSEICPLPVFLNMQIPSTFFGNLSEAQFLAEYWQKKPLLVRGAWPGFESPLSPEAFLALSARSDAYSRLMVRLDGNHRWDVREGPFSKAVFEKMPDSQWTLLIQEVDRLVPEVREMLQVVSFLPNWRLDDIMISYAANGGGVGAHTDNYDVFLLQGYGRRRWQINTVPVVEENLIEGIDVSILADFVPDCDWVLEPGDMLYLPPKIAHHGVALGPCMTFSIGCRAPGALEFVTGLLDNVLSEMDPEERYSDPHLKPGRHPGLLGDQVVEWAKSLVQRVIDDKTALTNLVGKILSEPRREAEEGPYAHLPFGEIFGSGKTLKPYAASQLIYVQNPDSTIALFAAGEMISLDASSLPALQALISVAGLKNGDFDLDPDFLELLESLWEQGTLIFQ